MLTSAVWMRQRVDARSCRVPDLSCFRDACTAHKLQRLVLEWSLTVDPPNTNSTLPLVFQSRDCCDGFSGWNTDAVSPWSEWAYPDMDSLSLPCNATDATVVRTRTRNATRTCDAKGTACEAAVCSGSSVVSEVDAEPFPVSLLPSGWLPFQFGPWGPWQPTGEIECGKRRVLASTRQGQRRCESPWPACRCVGAATTTQTRTETLTGSEACDGVCSVDGAWSEWTPAVGSSWSPWSVWAPEGCDVAQTANRTRTVTRSCTAPAPACGGRTCEGADTAVDVERRQRTSSENCCGESRFAAAAAAAAAQQAAVQTHIQMNAQRGGGVIVRV